jgi:TonB family protein
MIARKIMFRFILASCAFHVAFLSLAGILISAGFSTPVETFFVQLADMPAKQADSGRKEEAKKELSLEKPQRQETAGPEETVDLANPGEKYRTYLRELRRRIESRWVYPQDSYSRQETGKTVVRFSIQSNGALAATNIVSSSGFESLDRGALSVVQAAAPYSAFPENFNLSTLHIVATFQYEMD